jgi:hypothetical protein
MGCLHRHHVFDPTTDFSLPGLGLGSKLHDKGSLGWQGDCGCSALQVTSFTLPLHEIDAYRMKRNGSGIAEKSSVLRSAEFRSFNLSSCPQKD